MAQARNRTRKTRRQNTNKHSKRLKGASNNEEEDNNEESESETDIIPPTGSKRKHSTADDDNEKDVNDPSDSTNNPPKGRTTRRQLKKKRANTLELGEQDLSASHSHLIERTTPHNPLKLPPGDPPSPKNSATIPRNPSKLPPGDPPSSENSATTPRNQLKLPPAIDPPSPASPENNATTPRNPSKLPPIDPPSPASPENNATTPRNPSKLPPIDPPSPASPENNAMTPHNPSKLPPNNPRHLNRKQASPDIHAEPYKMFLGGQDPLVSTPNDWEEEDDGLTAAIVAHHLGKISELRNSYREKAWALKPHLSQLIDQRCNLEAEALAFLPYHPRDEEEDGDKTPLSPEEIEEEELRTFKRDSDNPDNVDVIYKHLKKYDMIGVYGIYFRSTYLYRKLVTSFLPEVSIPFQKRFGPALPLEMLMLHDMQKRLPLDPRSLADHKKHLSSFKMHNEMDNINKSNFQSQPQPRYPPLAGPSQPQHPSDPLFDTLDAVHIQNNRHSLFDLATAKDKPSHDDSFAPDAHGSGEECHMETNRASRHGAQSRHNMKGKEKAKAVPDDEPSSTEDEGLLREVPSSDEQVQGGQKRGPLPILLKKRLDSLRADYDNVIHELSREYKIDSQRLFSYIHPETPVTRNLNLWNIFEMWYGKNGETKKPESMPLGEWSTFVSKELDKYLKGKLPVDKLKDPDAREEALEEQIEWYHANMDNFIEQKKQSGRMGKTLLKILRPIIAMSRKIQRETGYEIGGYAVHSELESVAWVGTDLLETVKATHGTQMITQAMQIASLVQVQKMVDNNIDKKLRELANHCMLPKGVSTRDRDRKVVPKIFAYDAAVYVAECILGKDGAVNIEPSKLQPTTFLTWAYQAKCRIVNWPVGVPFIHGGGKTQQRINDTVKSIHGYTAGDMGKIAHPRIAHIMRASKNEEEPDDAEPYFEMVRWSEDEQRLPLDRINNLPLVSDTDGNSIVAVAQSEAYQEAITCVRANDMTGMNADAQNPVMPNPQPEQRLYQPPPPLPPRNTRPSWPVPAFRP
ncbi:hypothetical protein DFJ43DRAFT_1162639 [Lentinula guzmanii]|uniref:Uncharacterized protein n=1 Tax=Lentinula guzmanii TaxID=2804957 RepID=A0AA38J5Y2_9AGAR|nr:hypothetical protein DFJ43DRAFT_1162639 [Lentinula guzmanii]